MSTALIVSEHKLPVNHGHKPVATILFPGHLGMLPATLPAMNPKTGRFDWIVVERQSGIYGPDARIIDTVSPGMAVNIYA